MRPGWPAPNAYLFFGVFTGVEALFDRVRERIVEKYGPLHPRGESPIFPFPQTRTYSRTMGPGLQRKFFVLANRWPQDGLASVKQAAIEMESEIRAAGSHPVDRPVNIDPGILNDCRIILASTKDYSHRIYRGDGIWEEVTLSYENGAYKALPWTYPDFKNPEYHVFFEGFRQELLKLIQSERPPPPGRVELPPA